MCTQLAEVDTKVHMTKVICGQGGVARYLKIRHSSATKMGNRDMEKNWSFAVKPDGTHKHTESLKSILASRVLS